MFAIAGKDGKISVVRIGTTITILGVLVVLVSLVTFFVDQAARTRPLDVEPPSGATSLGTNILTSTSQRRYFSIPQSEMSVEQVASYYTDRIINFGNAEDSQPCLRFPTEGTYAGWEPGTGRVPYQFVCVFDNSGFNTIQFTEVRVQPGIFDEDPERNTEGLVMIQYEQQWSQP
ncbi:MAG: hypothetical protein AAF125_17475 [Chloroflexota bacterium]